MTGGRTKLFQFSASMAAKKTVCAQKKREKKKVNVSQNTAAHAGGGQRAPKKSISDTEMYSVIQA